MIYITKDYRNIFFINLKCCFSSFERNLLEEDKILKLNIKWSNNTLDNEMLSKIPEDVKLYIIIRNPISRFCSFYKDKFVACFNCEPKNNKQNCHICMYKYFSEEYILKKGLSISDIISAIKLGYNEGHISRQSDILKCNIWNKDINIIRMEDPEFNNICKSIIGCEMPYVNSTEGNQIQELTVEDTDFLCEYYKADFELYNSGNIYSNTVSK